MAEEEATWFIMIGQERQGPMSTHDVKYLLSRKRIDGGTLIWQEGMETWARLREVEEFQPQKKKSEEKPEPEPNSPPPEPASAPAQAEPASGPLSNPRLQRTITVVALLGLIGGGAYVMVSDPPRPRRQASTRSPAARSRTPSDAFNRLKSGSRGAEQEILRAGAKAVPVLVQALMDKGMESSLPPDKVKDLLTKIGPAASSAIGDALGDVDVSSAAKSVLVNILGEFGGPQSLPALIIALGDPDEEVQQKAKQAIAKMDPEMGPALASYFSNPVEPLSKIQKKNLAEAMGRQGSLSALPGLEAAAQTERNPEVKHALALAILRIKSNPTTTSAPTTPGAGTDTTSKPIGLEKVRLDVVHDALAQEGSDLSAFFGANGAWSGNLETLEPVLRIGNRALYLARGSTPDKDFIVSVPARARAERAIEAGIVRTWNGRVDAFRIVDDRGSNRRLPVLDVNIELRLDTMRR